MVERTLRTLAPLLEFRNELPSPSHCIMKPLNVLLAISERALDHGPHSRTTHPPDQAQPTGATANRQAGGPTEPGSFGSGVGVGDSQIRDSARLHTRSFHYIASFICARFARFRALVVTSFHIRLLLLRKEDRSAIC